MGCYVGIDLHANNSVVVVSDEADRVLYQKRLRNELSAFLTVLEPYRAAVQGIVVESTYNWYWLVDGLMEAGYRVHLAHAPALPQYSGLKHVDDQHDARWLAHLLRLELLPTGYIYPKAERAVRDLLRKRSQLVRHKTMVVLSLQSLLTRLTGTRLSLPRLRQLTPDGIQALVSFPEHVQAGESSLTVLQCLEHEVRTIEDRVREAGRTQPGYGAIANRPGYRADPGGHHSLGSRRHPAVCDRGALRLLLSLCRQRACQQWQTERRRQYEERQQVSQLGLHRSRPLCHSL